MTAPVRSVRGRAAQDRPGIVRLDLGQDGDRGDAAPGKVGSVPETAWSSWVTARRGHEAAGVEPLLACEPVEELEHREDDAVELLAEHAQPAGQDAPAHVIQRAQLLLERLLPAGQELAGIVWIGQARPGDGLAGADRDEPVPKREPPGDVEDGEVGGAAQPGQGIRPGGGSASLSSRCHSRSSSTASRAAGGWHRPHVQNSRSSLVSRWNPRRVRFRVLVALAAVRTVRPDSRAVSSAASNAPGS